MTDLRRVLLCRYDCSPPDGDKPMHSRTARAVRVPPGF